MLEVSGRRKETYRVMVVGAGSMAEAFIRGITQERAVTPGHVWVINRSGPERLEELRDTYGISPAQSYEEAAQADLVVLSVKPLDMAIALEQVRPFLDGQLLMSFAAGVPRSWLLEQVHGRAHVIRAMPNLPVAVLKGATAVTFGPEIAEGDRLHVLYLLEQLGEVVELPESLMDAATAFSGSGPGFVCYFLEAMEDAAVDLGIPAETARTLLLQTVVGTAATLAHWGLTPAELRRRVTSPGGTTNAGVTAMQEGNLNGVVLHSLRAAAARSAELGQAYRE